MITADILEVFLSTNNNHYLLVVQDYFTKGAVAIPLLDQTAARITGELTKLFSIYSHPEVFHLNQGCNFECSLFAQTLEAFGSANPEPWHITHKEMIWLNALADPSCSSYEPTCMLTNRMTGNATCHLYAYRTSVHLTHFLTLHTFGLNLQNYMILLKPNWQQQLTIKNRLMINTQQHRCLQLVSQFGSQSQQPENWILRGKGNGSSSQ